MASVKVELVAGAVPLLVVVMVYSKVSPGEIVEPRGQARHLAAHLAHQLAGVADLEPSQAIRVRVQRLGTPAHDRVAIAWVPDCVGHGGAPVRPEILRPA